jgi:hypothetical protein
MKNLWKMIAKISFYVVAAGLMAYAAMRTLHFIQATLPADQQAVGYLALLATSVGAIAWLLVFLHYAEGIAQKAIALILVLVDTAGEFAIFAFDTLLVTGEAGMIEAMTPSEVQTVVVGMSALIAINIFATIVYHLVDVGNMREMRESFVKDKLEGEAMKLIEKRGEEIAREMAPKLAEEWADEFQERFKSIRSLGIGNTIRDEEKAKKRPAPALFDRWPQNGNGNGHAAVEDEGEPEMELVGVPEPVGFSPNGNGHKPSVNGHKSPDGSHKESPANPTE